MKIGIDVSLSAEAGTGIGNYIVQLVHSLADTDSINFYTLYSFFFQNYREKVGRITIPPAESFIYKPFRFPARLSGPILKFSHISLERLIGICDIVHIPGFNLLPSGQAKLVVTIYDLSVLIYPETYTRPIRKSFQQFLRKVKERADVIIAISDNTKADLINLGGFPPHIIKVIPLAPNKIFKPISDRALIHKTIAKYALPESFILYVGNLNPRKNIVRLLKAYEIIKNEHYPKLVIVGQKGWLYGEIFDTVAKSNLSDDIIFLGHTPELDLIHIYNAATLFIYPSLYEGFGLPVLEAMACGTPIVTSNVSSLPEVAGDAARLVDPYNVEEIAFAMESMLKDEELRKKISQKGLDRVKCFSWEKTAKETLNVYREVYEQR